MAMNMTTAERKRRAIDRALTPVENDIPMEVSTGYDDTDMNPPVYDVNLNTAYIAVRTRIRRDSTVAIFHAPSLTANDIIANSSNSKNIPSMNISDTSNDFKDQH